MPQLERVTIARSRQQRGAVLVVKEISVSHCAQNTFFAPKAGDKSVRRGRRRLGGVRKWMPDWEHRHPNLYIASSSSPDACYFCATTSTGLIAEYIPGPISAAHFYGAVKPPAAPATQSTEPSI
ncbi:hypothetical protein HPB48_010181 [Haemaphysalis longicornis]|uniref:Uncharacterized protein n=1 Tax=Haemaphysalis longicornis TaxID=44386 RepID=A0A9J6FVW4_HAELO|nr:hypothetical protein HPB48_010181 [Haemaphysalis longicornis]